MDRTAVVVIDCDIADLDLCEGLDRALVVMEGVDVADGCWRAWDLDGRVIELSASTPTWKNEITARRTGRLDEDGLRTALLRHLNALPGRRPQDSEELTTLSDVVGTALEEVAILGERPTIGGRLRAWWRERRW